MKTDIKTKIKCVVWDLDNTLWKGTLLEDINVKLNNNVVTIIKELDRRGILQSIASKNDEELAINQLKEFGLIDFFIYEHINWNLKSESIREIASEINIGLDTIAFIDDQDFELDEVKFQLTDVLCINSIDINSILEREEFIPRFITKDSKNRRQLYINDIRRKKIEDNFIGPKEAFLESLNLKFHIKNVEEEDLKRVEELTVRTNQLNSTGYTFSYEELQEFINSDNYRFYVAELRDVYGDYGKIGIMLINETKDKLIIKLLLMSCRVMSRGVGNIFLNFALKLGKSLNKKIIAEFNETKVNRIMYISYKFSNFKEINRTGSKILLEHNLSNISDYPKYIDVIINE